MQNMTAADIATSSNNMLMLKPDAMLNPTKVEEYQNNGYSHVFVYEQTVVDQDDYQILGVLELKVMYKEINHTNEYRIQYRKLILTIIL